MRGEVIKLGMAEACSTHYSYNNLQFYFICGYLGVGVGVKGVCGWGENSGNYTCAKTVYILFNNVFGINLVCCTLFKLHNSVINAHCLFIC